VIPHL